MIQNQKDSALDNPQTHQSSDPTPNNGQPTPPPTTPQTSSIVQTLRKQGSLPKNTHQNINTSPNTPPKLGHQITKSFFNSHQNQHNNHGNNYDNVNACPFRRKRTNAVHPQFCTRKRNKPIKNNDFKPHDSGVVEMKDGIFCMRKRKAPRVSIQSPSNRNQPNGRNSVVHNNNGRGPSVATKAFQNALNFLENGQKSDIDSNKDFEKFKAVDMSNLFHKEEVPDKVVPIIPETLETKALITEEVHQPDKQASLSSSRALTKRKEKSIKQLELTVKQSERAKKLFNPREQLKVASLIILPEDKFRFYWNIIITLFLLFTAIVTPYRISFVEKDEIEWVIIDAIVDFGFFCDIILNFFSAYYDEDFNLIVEKRQIAENYIKSWFIIDTVAIIPINHILSAQKNYTSLARIARLPRLYRLLKIFKLTRVFRIMRQKSSNSYQSEVFSGIEKFSTFILLLFILCHLIACFWYLMGNISESSNSWITNSGYQDATNFDTYVGCFHFAFTLITTMGDSGITAVTTEERIICIIAMCVGVCAYSFALSSLTSFIQNLDSKQGELKERLNTLENLRFEYNIDYITYIQLKKAVRYDYSVNDTDKIRFINQLPQPLKIKLAVLMNQHLINQIHFFQNKPPQFIAFISQFLRPLKVLKNQYIFREGDNIDEIYFLRSGKVGFVLEDFDDMTYITVHEGNCFGELSIFYPSEEEGRRLFTMKAMEDCELLAISKEDLVKLDSEFPQILAELVQEALKKLKKTLKMKNKAEEFCEDQLLAFTDSQNNTFGHPRQNYEKEFLMKHSPQNFHEEHYGSLESSVISSNKSSPGNNKRQTPEVDKTLELKGTLQDKNQIKEIFKGKAMQQINTLPKSAIGIMRQKYLHSQQSIPSIIPANSLQSIVSPQITQQPSIPKIRPLHAQSQNFVSFKADKREKPKEQMINLMDSILSFSSLDITPTQKDDPNQEIIKGEPKMKDLSIDSIPSNG